MQGIIISGITAIAYAVVELIKATLGKKYESIKHVFPMIAGTVGILCGIVVYATHLIDVELEAAVLMGLSSGLAATGANQIGKQIQKFDAEQEEENDGDKN